jgi:hypothetical protein
MANNEQLALVDATVQEICPILADKAPEVVGAILTDLLAMLIAGHHPAVRKTVLDLLLETLPGLIEVNAAMFADRIGHDPWKDSIQ